MVSELIKQAELIQTKQGLPETKLNIACLMSISHVVLPRALVEFRKAYPQVDFEVREGIGTFVNEEVQKGVWILRLETQMIALRMLSRSQ